MSSPTQPIRPLDERDLAPDPFVQFVAWLDGARTAGVHEPEAMTLATTSSTRAPSARMVLLRGWGADGFVFFSNYESRKAGELDANPRAALVLHWALIGRQIRIEGAVARTTDAESDAYFATRERGSQISAWASPQSRPIPDRAALEQEVADLTRRFGDAAVPRPPNWGGYRLMPSSFEFWQHADNRLHDRFRYTQDGHGWRMERLAP
jgi:pyridoxamine 5'-phosphate oxidase